jgi:triosephosphate isomerase (TIM)
MSKYIVIGNWKMNPETLGEAKTLFLKVSKSVSKLKKTDVVICPPFPYLSIFKSKSKKFFLGAQDSFIEKSGAYTGEVSPTMLKSLGVSYVILGHSERRSMGETDHIVNKKIEAVLRAKMTPVVCIGEPVHDNQGNYLAFLREQIKNCFAGLSRADLSKVIIAYEPIWAIGEKAKGAMDSRVLHETVLYIQKILSEQYGRTASLKARIIYGGSVDETNALDLIKNGEVIGFLPGRASLNPEIFKSILHSVDNN